MLMEVVKEEEEEWGNVNKMRRKCRRNGRKEDHTSGKPVMAEKMREKKRLNMFTVTV